MNKLLIIGLPLILVTALVIAIGIYFHTVDVDATVSEALSSTTVDLDFSGMPGETITKEITINNAANVDLTVNLEWTERTNPIGKLILENKDSTNWDIIIDDVSAILKYHTEGTSFTYDLTGKVPLSNTDYILIYYADKQDRFENWGGDNPGALIVKITSDGSGNIVKSGATDLGTVLPNQNDWNANPDPDYCNNHNGYDSYTHCNGAKIWLVLASDYDETNKKLTAWNPSNYLFETDLISSNDADKVLYTIDIPENKLLIPGINTVNVSATYDTTTPIGGFDGAIKLTRS